MSTLIDQPNSPLWVEESNLVVGGYINNTENHLLAPEQAVRLLNVYPTVAGRRQRRTGVACLGTGIASAENPTGLWEFYVPTAGVQHLVAKWGTGLYTSQGDDLWTRQSSNISLANTYYMGVQGRGPSSVANLFLASCVACSDNVSLPYVEAVRVDSGAFAVTNVSGISARCLAWFQGRLWAYNLCGSGLGPTYLTWSKPLDGSDFSAGQSIQIDADTGDVGCAILPSRDNTPRLFLFNERSVYQLDMYWTTDGYYPSTANALDFTKSQLRPIVIGSGCIATRTCIWAPGLSGADILFLSHEGIRYLSRSQTDAQGGTPLPLSYRIQPTIDRINWNFADRSTAAYYDGFAYFAVPVDGAAYNNLVIAYDIHRDAFHELDFNVAAWADAKLAAGRSLFFLSSTAGTESGLNTGAGASGVTYGFHVYQTGSGSVDPFSHGIRYIEETRAFCCDQGGQPGTNLRIKKKWDYLELAVQSGSTAATLTVEYKVDDTSAWSILDYFYSDPDTAAPYLPVQLPFGFGSGKIVRRNFLLRNVQPGYKIQFRLSDSESFSRFKIISLLLSANPLNPKYNRSS